MSKPRLELVSLVKEYGDGSVVAVDGIDLCVSPGETLALLGPSGCGKSTTLNMIVGLENPTSGDIQIDGKSIVGVAPGRRNVGLVFQDYAVFTAMTVRQNLAFGLAVRNRPDEEINRAVDEVAELLGMTDRLRARARDLGSSELQRVAIGRTLVTKPAILLLDEPLSNLEADARLAMRRELRRLQADMGLTIIYVTHDQIEALSLADRIAVMHNGKILQIERTAAICDRPDHTFVAGFLGSPPMNLLRGTLTRDAGGLTFWQNTFALSLAEAALGDVLADLLPDGQYTLGLPPHALAVTAPTATGLVGRVLFVEARGPDAVLTVEVADVRLKVVVPAVGRPAEGLAVGLSVDPGAVVFFGGDSNRRIDVKLAGRPQ